MLAVQWVSMIMMLMKLGKSMKYNDVMNALMLSICSKCSPLA